MKKTLRWFLLALMAATLVMAGCEGDDGDNGAPGPPGPPGPPASAEVTPESCAVCHAGAGDEHQAAYDMYTDASNLVATVDSVISTAQAPVPNSATTYNTVMLFTVTENGLPYTAGTTTAANGSTSINGLGQQRYMGALYNTASMQFESPVTFSNPVDEGNGQYSVLAKGVAFDIENQNGFVYLYVAKDLLFREGSIQLYDNLSNVGMKFGTWSYASLADVKGCQSCHGAPYNKHGYRAAVVPGLEDFVACKACHYDTRNGNHSEGFFGDPNYAYKATVMNDTHASHNNEFPYPQSMSACVTCHGDNLAATLDDVNFVYETCQSCHADVAAPNDIIDLPLETVVPHAIPVQPCNDCHMIGGIAPGLAEIHPGYDRNKYTSLANEVANKLEVTYNLSSVVYNATTNGLTVQWGAKDEAGDSLDVLNLDPAAGPVFLGDPADRDNESEGTRILFGYYGWGTKNIANYDQYRKAEILANTTYDSTAGLATTTFTLTDKVDTYSATEVGVGLIGVPEFDGVMVPVVSQVKSIHLADNSAFDRFGDIVDEEKCNACHSNLIIHTNSTHGHTAVTNVEACLFCHNTSSAAHVEEQSRAIDSYLHNLHNFVGEEFVYPMFTLANCYSCHLPGSNNPPDQTKSSGALTASDPENVTIGPGAKSCGSCHRAQALKESDQGFLASLNSHMAEFGYRVAESVESFVDVMNQIFAQL